jgi:hypothetical protein
MNYERVWTSMNDLEMVTSKICSAREILDSATDALVEHKYDKVESLITAAHEFLGYYLDEFDNKFKDAWKETVVAQKNKKFDDWEEYYYPEEHQENKVTKWIIPIELDGLTGECYLSLPDDLLEQVGLIEGDQVIWKNNNDGSFTVMKQTNPIQMDEC